MTRLPVLKFLIEIGLFSFVLNLLMLVIPLYLLQVYDRVLPSASTETLLYSTVIAIAALLLLAFLEAVRAIYANRAAARLDVAFSRDAVLMSIHSKRAELGDVQALRDLSNVRRFLGGRGIFALFDLPFAPLFIGLLWLVHPALFWITAGGAVVLAALAVANQRATAAAYREGGDQGMLAMMTAQSFVRNGEMLRSMGMVENAIQAWSAHHIPTLNSADRAAWINGVFAGVSRFVRFSLQIAVLGMGAWYVLAGEMTAGMIFASSIISGRGLQPIDQVIGGWPQLVEARNAWKRFQTTIAGQKAPRTYTTLPAPEGHLDVENLVYLAQLASGENVPILKQFSFRAPAGSVIGIIGPSGAGKSTLARLLVGAIQPASGTIRLDGSDIANWDPDLLGNHIGYLPQDVELLPGTVAQNIARFSSDYSDDDVIEASKRAQVHQLIQSLPKGYDTQIGPQGLTLSGGQRQRVGLARAFYGTPALLVLDEPNANLDGDGELALEKAIEEATALGATVVVITQRRSLAKKVDLLMVLRGGTIEDYGRRDEVLQRQEAKFRQMAADNAAKPSNVIKVSPSPGGQKIQYSMSGYPAAKPAPDDSGQNGDGK